MASLVPCHTFSAKSSLKQFTVPAIHSPLGIRVAPSSPSCKKKSFTVVAAVGELSSGSTNYLIAGAATIALVGTAFPILFSRKDLCPECDGAGFIRKTGITLRANAARKEQAQIVCPRCTGLGKLNQIENNSCCHGFIVFNNF